MSYLYNRPDWGFTLAYAPVRHLLRLYTESSAHMSNLLTRLTVVHSPDPDVQRRGRVLIIISLAMAAIAVAYLPVGLASINPVSAIMTLIVATGVFVGAAILGRLGRVNWGAWLVIGCTIVAILASIANSANSPGSPFYMVLAVLLAGVLLPPVHIWSVLVIAVLGEALVFSMLPEEVRSQRIWIQTMQGVPLLLVIVSVISFVSSRGVDLALKAAREARSEAEMAREELAQANAGLEVKVVERTAELQRVLEAQQATTAELQASLAAQQELNRIIAELSVPVIPVTDDTLVVPIVGAMDSTRADLLIGEILRQVEQSRARTIILDVTGVPIVDTQVAAILLQVAQATNLMGTATMLCGIRPEVAQALVHLGVELSILRTRSTLQDALAELRIGREHV